MTRARRYTIRVPLTITAEVVAPNKRMATTAFMDRTKQDIHVFVYGSTKYGEAEVLEVKKPSKRRS
jgi:hypothetical protein